MVDRDYFSCVSLIRLIQYLSRFIWTILDGGVAVDRLKRLEETLSTSRKRELRPLILSNIVPSNVIFDCNLVLQLGRFIDTLNSARSSVLIEDRILNLTLTMSKVSNSLFILSDNILWAGRVGVINIDRIRWFRTSFKLWLYSILMNLVRDLYEFNKLLKPSAVTRVKESIQSKFQATTSQKSDPFPPRSVPETDPIEQSRRVLKVLAKNKPLTIDVIKNLADVWIPLNGLNHVTLSPRLIGLLGTISSTCALIQVMYPSLRLNPS